MILSHKIALDPTYQQEAYFRRACGAARFTYNWALAGWKRQYEAGEKPSGLALKKRFNAIRAVEFPWTYEVHRDCTARPFDQIQRAFAGFFRRVKAGQKPGYPRFKKKGQNRDSFYIANDKLALSDTAIRIPVIGWVRLREALRFTGKITGAVVSRRANRWFVAIQVDVGDVSRPRTSDAVVGVDLGIKASATLSTGEVLEGPRALRSSIERLRRLSRSHSRKTKGSKNRSKSAMVLARHHAKVADLRNDFLHKTTTSLCRENQAVVIEDLHVKGMLRNRRLARVIADEGWGELRRQLTYKALMFGTEVIVAPRFYPSSKTCSGCGNVKDTLLLSEREYLCDACGLQIDRDLNAALNLRSLGLATPEVTPVERLALVSTSVETKPASAKQEPNRAHLCAQVG